MNTNQNSDNSVLCALRELGALEEERIATERRVAAEAAEQQRETARRAAERKAAQEQQAQRENVEMLARTALEAEAKAKAEAERDQRMAAMRAELAVIQGERSELRAELLSRAAASPQPRPRSFGVAFGLSSVVAAALAGVLVMQAQHRAPAVPAEPTPVSIELGEIAAPPTVFAAEVEAVPAPVPVTVAAPAEAERRPHRHGARDRPSTVESHPTLESGLDFGEGDGLLPGDSHRAH